MSQLNNGLNTKKNTILINIDVGDEIIPEGHLRIEDIKVEPEMQQRALLLSIEDIRRKPQEDWLLDLTDKLYVERYIKMLNLSDPPPVTVYKVGEDLILVDGFNRLQASICANRETIPSIVIEGTREEALRGSCQANLFYRQHLSQKDEDCVNFTYLNNLSEQGKSLKENRNYTEIAGNIGFLDKSQVSRFLNSTKKEMENYLLKNDLYDR